MINSLCVFAGSSLGGDPSFARVAQELGDELVRRNYGLVYGGASVGLMGVVANAVLEAGGRVTGVIPSFMIDKEIAHPGLTEMKVVSSMHERKATMAELADGFIALPGGFGTVEEFFEIVTWAQLGLHAKPCGLLDVSGYYSGLQRFLDTAVEQRLLKSGNRDLVIVDRNPATMLDRFEAHAPAAVSKWIATELT